MLQEEAVLKVSNITPIRLSNEEQVALVKQICKATNTILEVQNLQILDKSEDKMTEAELKWFKSHDKDTMLRLYELKEMPESDLKLLVSQAREEQNSAFMKLWASIALLAYKELSKRYKNILFSKDKDTLINNTMMEVHKALANYDESLGAFSTYITPYLWQGGSQTNAAVNNVTVRNNHLRKKILEAKEEIESSGKKATHMLIHEISGVSINLIKEILEEDEMKSSTLSIEAMDKGAEVFSDDNREDLSLKSMDSPEDAYEAQEMSDAVERTMKKLDKKTRKIIDLKIGFTNSATTALTDNEIATKLGITQQEVISRYNTAIRSLKKYIEENEPLLNNQSVKEKRDAFDSLLHFIPTNVSKEDIEDAYSIMESVNLGDVI